MSYIYRVLKNGPIAIYPLDGNFNDVSGFGFNGTATGTPTVTRPIVSGGISAYQFSGTQRVNFPLNNFMQAGFENKPFTLALWYKPDATAGTAALFARNNSGIFASGTDIEFRIDKGGLASAKFSGVEAGNRYFIVAIYDGIDAYLYVNNVSAASASVNDGLFADTATSLRIEASGGAVFTVDSPTVFNFALTANTVEAHWNYGNAWTGVAEISAANGGNVYRIWDGNANLFYKLVFDSNDEWANGGYTGNAVAADGTLTQQWDEANSQYGAGEWIYSQRFEEAGSLTGTRVSWDATSTNLTVSVSIDGGISFTPVANGANAIGAQTLDAGFEPIFKISLPAGATRTAVTSFTVAFFTSKDVFGTNEDLPGTSRGDSGVSIAEYDYEPNSFNNNAGVGFSGATSSLMFPRDPEFGDYRSVEMTVYIDTLPTSGTVLQMGTATITANGSGQWVASGLTALIINGVAVNTGSPITIDAKKPHHIIATFPALGAALYIGNNSAGTAGYAMRVGYLATYYNVIANADATYIYNAWVGTAATRITDTNEMTISEHTYAETGLPFRGYAYAWSITGAG